LKLLQKGNEEQCYKCGHVHLCDESVYEIPKEGKGRWLIKE
jgi:hypothetical protein